MCLFPLSTIQNQIQWQPLSTQKARQFETQDKIPILIKYFLKIKHYQVLPGMLIKHRKLYWLLVFIIEAFCTLMIFKKIHTESK